jgi:uncharacterized protein
MHEILDIGLANMASILQLNNANARETSRMDAPGMCALLDSAFYSRGVDHGATAFLIALDQDAPYNNFNFNWFKDRYDSFVYIDRVVVAQAAREQGLARALYQDLIARAEKAGHCRVVCEVNFDPPNPISDAFHSAMGFVTVGHALICNGAKEVRDLERISSPAT